MDPNARARPSQDLSAAEKMQLREVFAIVDQDGSNALDWMELRDALRGLGFPVTKRKAKALYAAADKNPRDLLEFDGFLTIVTALGRTEVQHEQEILQVRTSCRACASGAMRQTGGASQPSPPDPNCCASSVRAPPFRSRGVPGGLKPLSQIQ